MKSKADILGDSTSLPLWGRAGDGAAIQEAVDFISQKTRNFKPETAIILGSGIGFLAEEVENPVMVKYSEIPHFPVSTVKGHAGRLVFGNFQGKKTVFMQGRFHFYEGYPMPLLAFPVRVFKKLGVKILIVTNAAGAVNRNFIPGDLMLITDHINFSFQNPLFGKNLDEFGPRFPDTQHAYSPELIEVALDAAKKENISLKQGIYLFNTGPTYETPAEVRMAAFLGADAVGMSTFPEVLMAAHCGMKVLGISYISNLAAGISGNALSHEEVMEAVALVKDKFSRLLKEVVKQGD